MKTSSLPALITPGTPIVFPPDEAALSEPNGLIAIGGDLEPERLLTAYRRGIFPWYEADQPILWWTPEPRCVLFPAELHISRSLRRQLRQDSIEISKNQAFGDVVRACAEPREPGGGTWITTEMLCAYEELHRLGHAHSIEIWRNKRLIGGLYGVAIGAAFFGESMFCRESNTSKIALVALCEQLASADAALIDCQVVSPHLLSLGAQTISRSKFRGLLDAALEAPNPLRS